MPEIFINDVRHTFGWAQATWGDLLAGLEEHVAADGVVLTTTRFDGVEEPSFRDPRVTARRLADVARVDIETATPAVFLRRVLLDAIVPLQEAADVCARLSAVYRRQDVSAGHAGLTSLASELRGLTVLVAMLTGPLQIDLGTSASDGTTAADEMETLGVAIDALVSAQESEDWLTVADVLEYDLDPAIRRWIDLLTAVANRVPDR